MQHAIETPSIFAPLACATATPWPAKVTWPRWAMIPYLALAMFQSLPLAVILTFSDRVIYTRYSSVDDQALAGVIMWVPGSLPLLLPHRRIVAKSAPPPFRYFDKGTMAVVGRGFAVLQSGRVRLSGFLAWLAWAAVHLEFLGQSSLRVSVFVQWVWMYVTGQRGSRLIVNHHAPPRGFGAMPDLHAERPPSTTIAGAREVRSCGREQHMHGGRSDRAKRPARRHPQLDENG
jgi:hypothetical protein